MSVSGTLLACSLVQSMEATHCVDGATVTARAYSVRTTVAEPRENEGHLLTLSHSRPLAVLLLPVALFVCLGTSW